MSSSLPPLLLTSEPGSFAQRTFQTRIPRIIDNILATNDYPIKVVAALRALRDEIVGGRLRLLQEETDDREFWNAQARVHLGTTWLDLPWYWAEAFFYRRVLEATHYFQDGEFCRRDPFAPAKRAELQPDRALRATDAALEDLPSDVARAFNALLHASLWGNRTDLSFLAARREAQSFDDEHANLLVDDSARVWEFLRGTRGRVSILGDNAGTELCFDLALVDFLLRANLAKQIVLHLKPQPLFVSDAMIQDVVASLDAFGESTAPNLRQLAQRLAHALNQGHLVLSDHPFWVTGFFFHDLPSDLRATLEHSSLVISKGDANYRRLIGDCHWGPTARFEDAVAHFPAPVVALRTLKAELIVGLQPGEAERLHAQDADWLANGKRGVIQFAAVEK